MAELTEAVKTAEEVVHMVSDSDISMMIRKKDLKIFSFIGVAALSGAAVGATISWFYAYKKASTKFDDLLGDEIARMRAHYAAKTEATMGRITKPDLDEVVDTLGYRVEGKVYHPDDVEKITPAGSKELMSVPPAPRSDILVEVVPTTNNVFEEAKTPGVWDYADEVRSRDPGVPYIIHIDEFTQAEKGYTQSTLTYYEDDDVLADERDTVIEDQDDMMGVQNLARFGHGSNDPNLVYVRNDLRQLDMEICRSPGSFAEEVHGLKHSDEPRRRRPSWDG